MRRASDSIASLMGLAILSLGIPGLAASTIEPTQQGQAPQVAAVPAEALKFGAALEQQAAAELKSWVRSYAHKQMRERPVDPKGTMAVVDQRFPQASEEACDAGTFLLFYTAYKDEEENQKMLAIRLRDIDRDTKEITRQLQVLWKNEQNRSASPLQAMSAQERVRMEEQIQKMEAELRELADERQLKATQLEASQKKVNLYLKLLAVAYQRMKGTDAAIIRTLR